MTQAVIYLLGTVQGALGDLDCIASVNRLGGYLRAAPDFTAQRIVVYGASDLLVEIFGEAGRHVRTATGVSQTPFGAAVQLEMTLRLK